MELELELYSNIQETTCTEYDNLAVFKEKESVLVTNEVIESMLEDLLCEVGRLKEELEDLEKDLKENYKPIPVAEQVGVSDRDFI